MIIIIRVIIFAQLFNLVNIVLNNIRILIILYLNYDLCYFTYVKLIIIF